MRACVALCTPAHHMMMFSGGLRINDFVRTIGRDSGIRLARRVCLARGLSARVCNVADDMSKKPLDKTTSNADWKMLLSAEEYRVLRMKGTEMPGTGMYNKFKEKGVYNCAACGAPLFTSEQKFDSGCGWPAFFDEVPGSLDREVDKSMGAVRTEIMCKNCGGHLGHEFKGEGFPNPTDIRHCVNSVSIKFEKADE